MIITPIPTIIIMEHLKRCQNQNDWQEYWGDKNQFETPKKEDKK